MAFMLGVSILSLLQWARGSRNPFPPGSGIVARVLLIWLFLGYLQNLLPGDRWLLTMGYVVLPLSLLSVWGFVLINFGSTIKTVLGQRRYLALALTAAVLYAGFYLWSTNLVAPPEPDEMPAPGTAAFVIPFQAYGPLAIWPDIEFWIPELSLFGAISVGTAMVVFTLAPLIGMSLALLAVSLAQRISCYRGSATLGGVAFVALGTNFCCCCAPAIYPLIATVLGTTTASSLAVWMVGSASPFYNLTQIVTLSLTLSGIGLLVHRVKTPATSYEASNDKWLKAKA
ncbi:MAG: hypothetical protein ACE5JP_09090 [Candidatus Bipolaricaulia bacterium]